ncbi:Tim44 domain-containing protein [Billgrantia sulfidoxydans]|uniref:Tim44 domain-containing protein n=1 Tax=Billgrantia sulfidoxydans TaxID=2733484 RepID=A0ABX7W3G6_9GAMM|nr:Tim44-like domain-containing protein [Halomonas sulfidoxydans]QTP53563.1 Tim44 domain-containing protein [Halomonas sulfidoxydans]
MRHFLVMLMVAVLGFGLAVEHAEARRMGGGGNVGSFSRSADRPAAAPNQAAPARQAQSNQATGSRMPGMLGGMLAGGLLAALFFGGAFDELRLMDILLMAGLGFLLFRLLARRRPAVAGGPQPAAERPSQFEPEAFQPAQGAAKGGGSFGSLPAWFDRERFLSGAKEHFMTLQRAWDNNDFADIQEYVTPELYNLLREERAKQPANNRTEIVRLLAELGNVREINGQAEATVIFHGILEENGEQTEFNETWHLLRDVRDGAPWYLQGIEQNAS